MVAPPASRQEALRWGAVFAAAAMAPDLDLIAGVHRGPTHSLTAALIAGGITWIAAAAAVSRMSERTGRGRPGIGVAGHALAVAAAYATHTLLDWLGADSAAPFGIMALWPMSDNYYESPLHVFLAISRRYARPGFFTLNIRAVLRELAILGPVAAVVAWTRARKLFTS
jgi:membrane-bound metal-dependent hydrolase YbcI (DUF457 family)